MNGLTYDGHIVVLSIDLANVCYVQVEGDTVTFTFEMKSGREHSTPDRAMWGFACTIRPQEATDDSPTGLPFVTDLYLSVTSVCCSLIGRLFSGPNVSSDERTCNQLLKYDLLQKCIWRAVEGSPEVLPLNPSDFPIPKSTPHTPLDTHVLYTCTHTTFIDT